MKRALSVISLVLVTLMIFPAFVTGAISTGSEKPSSVGETYYLGKHGGSLPSLDDQKISDDEYKLLSSLTSPIARLNVFEDADDASDGKGSYNSYYDKIAADGTYSEEQLARFSKEFDSYASHDEEYVYIAFRDLGASGEGFYSYRSNYNIRFTLNAEDPTKHFVLTGKSVDKLKLSSADNSGAEGISLSDNDFEKLVCGVQLSKYSADGRFLKSNNENNTEEEGAYELFCELKLSKAALLSYSNTYCGTDYATFPDVMYLNISAKHYTTSFGGFAEETNYEAMWFGGLSGSTDGEWEWAYGALVFGDEDSVISSPERITPDHDVLWGQNVYAVGEKKASIKIDGNISEGEYTYKTEEKGISQWFEGDGVYAAASSPEQSLSRITDEATRERTREMLESLRYTFYFAEDDDNFYIAFNQTGGYAADEQGLGQWPCRFKTDIRIGFDPCDSSKYLNFFYNNPSNKNANASILEAGMAVANLTCHPDKKNGYEADGIITAVSLKKFYTESMDTSLGSVNKGEQAIEGNGNNSQKAPSQTFVELSVSKTALLELINKGSDKKYTAVPNVLWFDLGATVYWTAQNAYGMTAGSGAYASSLTFTGKPISSETGSLSERIHMPDMVVFGDEKEIEDCSFTQRSENPTYVIREGSCTEKAVYYLSCAHCGSAAVRSFESENVRPHAYLYRVQDGKYLASAEDCERTACYYYSCACGASAGDDPDSRHRIFYSVGEILGHKNISTDFSSDGTHHWHICLDCNKAVISQYQTGKEAHIYNKEVADEKYVAVLGNCNTKTTYYKSCVCGAASDDAKATFEGGYESDIHKYGEKHSAGDTHHWSECVSCKAKSPAEPHVYDSDQDADCNVCKAVRIVGTDTTAPPTTSATTRPTDTTATSAVTILPATESDTTAASVSDTETLTSLTTDSEHNTSVGTESEQSTGNKVGCTQSLDVVLVAFVCAFACSAVFYVKRKTRS